MIVEPQWRATLDALLGCGDVAGATRHLSQRAVPLLAEGRADELAAAIDAWPPSDRPLALRLAEAAARFASPARPVAPEDLPSWEAELVRGYFAWRRDLAAGALVADVQASVAAPHQAEVALLARSLNAGASDYAGLRAALDPGFEKLATAGRPEWGLVWSIAIASVWSKLTLDDLDATVASLRADRQALVDLGSAFAPWASASLGFAELLHGDTDAMAAAFADVDGSDDPTGYASLTARSAGALAELFTAEPTDALIDELVACEGLWRGCTPVGMVGFQGIAATLLLDHGWVDQALHFTARAGPGMFLHREVFADRGQLIRSGDAAAADRLVQATAAARRIGWCRWATAERLRIARDCLRHDLDRPARALRAAADDDLAASSTGPSRWEAALLEATAAAATPRVEPAGVDRRAARSAPGAPDAILVLQPDVVVRRHGEPVAVSPQVAQLLALLVVERRAVTVDRAVDVLWPDASLADGRERLKRLVYRLRQALAIGPHELVVRRGDGLELNPAAPETTTWHVDAWAFWDESTSGDRPTRRAALARYDADLCHRQLAYDDTFAEARLRFAARWVDLAASLLDDEHSTDIDPVEVAARARAFGLLTPELAAQLADACRRQGRPAEAASMLHDDFG